MRMRSFFDEEFMDACEEPGCGEPAIKNWNGRKLCIEHYGNYILWEVSAPEFS